MFSLCPRRNPADRKRSLTGLTAVLPAVALGLGALGADPAAAQSSDASSEKKPNILFIMGDDIGLYNVGVYHRTLMVGETPNIDRLAEEGAMFTTYYAEQSCTSGRTAFATGMQPLRAGMLLPQLPGATSSLLPGTPAIGKFLRDLGYSTGQFGKNHLGDVSSALPTAHGFEEFWGYLYHLDAMQQVDFPDINSDEATQGVVAPCKNTPVKGLDPVPGAIDPSEGLCMTPPRPVLHCVSSDGTEANQSCTDEGPLGLDRSRTIDEEISTKLIDWLDRVDPDKTDKPFFAWYNPARMHVTTMLSPEYEAMLGVRGGKDWGINEVGMKQMDDNIGYVLKKLEDMGELDNTLVVFTTDNGAETITYPDGGITPFRGGKLTTWEGGMRAPMVARWPGKIEPGQVKDGIFSALDWMPTLVELAGGDTDDGLKKKIEAGAYDGIKKTTIDGVNQLDYLTGKSEEAARDYLFYYSGSVPSAVRYKNWKFYYAMAPSDATGGFAGTQPLHWTQLTNLKRDPFERFVLAEQSALAVGGALAAPSTAYIYDWNMLPIGQQMWLKELSTYKDFPPLQQPASYNLDQVIAQMQSAKTSGHASD